MLVRVSSRLHGLSGYVLVPVWQLKISFYRQGNFVIFRGMKRDEKSHIYKSSILLLVSNKEHCARYKKLSFCIRWYY